MELYLIRHGIADQRGTDYPNDNKRPLTAKGQEKTTNVAQRLRQMAVHFDVILSSPLVRARQTAEILRESDLSEKMIEFIPLAPGGDIQDWVNWWTQSSYNKDTSSLALVGHQPDLGNWAELLVWGSSQGKLVIKKAGILGLNLPTTGNPIGNSELFLFTSPKWLL